MPSQLRRSYRGTTRFVESQVKIRFIATFIVTRATFLRLKRSGEEESRFPVSRHELQANSDLLQAVSTEGTLDSDLPQAVSTKGAWDSDLLQTV